MILYGHHFHMCWLIFILYLFNIIQYEEATDNIKNSSMVSSIVEYLGACAPSRRFIMSSVKGLRTFTENPSLPRTCVVTPSYTKVAQCESQSLIRKFPYDPPMVTDSRGHIKEGRTSNLWSLAESYWQCSQHVCHEHWRQVLCDEDTR